MRLDSGLKEGERRIGQGNGRALRMRAIQGWRGGRLEEGDDLTSGPGQRMQERGGATGPR
jgi:hypothetical protein